MRITKINGTITQYPPNLSRISGLIICLGYWLAWGYSFAGAEQIPQLGNGLRNGWADQHSIVIWTRTTRHAEMNQKGPDFLQVPASVESVARSGGDPSLYASLQMPPQTQLDEMLGACPGAPGQVRLLYHLEHYPESVRRTPWTSTHADQDHAVQWKLESLTPGKTYRVMVEARPVDGGEVTATCEGAFQTAPGMDQSSELSFCVTTCHDFLRRDGGLEGHQIYVPMQAMRPDFVVHAGDIEYYDKPGPWAWTIELMRFKWGRLFSMPRNRAFYASHTTYFIKDDHDTLRNDCWPGQRYGNVSFKQGVQLFNEEQFPSRNPRYHSIAWGKDLSIWLLEGRDYRRPNTAEDGPSKTILGPDQKAWLKASLSASSATFKLVFTPTPIVGPDRPNKKDNHANAVFAHEGAELRSFFASIPGVILFCGDRHWQYASVDEETGLWEFGCGPGSAKHQLGWKVGDERPQHRFLRVAGGYLTGEVMAREDALPRLRLRHRDVYGSPVSEFVFPQ